MSKIKTTFGIVQVGQFFKQGKSGASDVFLKIKETAHAICKCGVGMNAYNITELSLYRVHFHASDPVLIVPGTRPLYGEEINSLETV